MSTTRNAAICERRKKIRSQTIAIKTKLVVVETRRQRRRERRRRRSRRRLRRCHSSRRLRERRCRGRRRRRCRNKSFDHCQPKKYKIHVERIIQQRQQVQVNVARGGKRASCASSTSTAVVAVRANASSRLRQALASSSSASSTFGVDADDDVTAILGSAERSSSAGDDGSTLLALASLLARDRTRRRVVERRSRGVVDVDEDGIDDDDDDCDVADIVDVDDAAPPNAPKFKRTSTSLNNVCYISHATADQTYRVASTAR